MIRSFLTILSYVVLYLLCILLVAVLLSGCGMVSNDTATDENDNESVDLPTATTIVTPNAPSCSVEEVADGAILSCPDGTYVNIKHGEKGEDGQNGVSCTIESMANGALITCGNTMATILNGTGCTTAYVSNGAVISCPDGTSSIVYNGTDGVDGVNGIDGLNGQDATPTLMIDPCKRAEPKINFNQPYFGLLEILLKTSNGKLIGTVDEKVNGVGEPALAEVIVDWMGGWAMGGPSGTSDCTFQYRTVTIESVTHKILWHPNTAPIPVSFNDSNVTIIE